MEKYRKKDMIEAINLLLHVNDSVVKNAKANKKEDIVDALSQCQDVALALGNYLESLDETGEKFVHILEDYCENLYQMSLIFSNENLCRKLFKKVKKQLSALKTSISLEIPDDKVVMMFLPYKSSMWDSLESVWKAASEDPECEAYVMPIPYFERNASGELAVEHYEGNQFPEYVPIVNYQNYSLEEHKPDVVFIHNPYDEYNYVTSIHPSYYIPELKKWGCKIVYIPYYISEEANPESIEVQKGREGYIVTPGVLYSDMVFVQSENIKRLFVNVLEKNVPDVGRRYWEEKIFGLGSPKLDRVHSIERNDAILSEKWKKVIYTEDGNRKKVILYNISLGALLNTPEMLDKIVDVLKFFKENTDVALWWRPHPLYESTLSSMRPDLLEKYREIVRKYKEEEWGIFDEGVDLEWAIAETDAYYGDSSSVVQLYKEVKKPIMIQNALVKAEKSITAEDIPIWPSTFYVEKEDVWLVHGKFNILMRYNMVEKYTYIISRIPNELIFHGPLYRGMYKWKNKIFLIPSGGREIGIYYIDNNFFEKLSIKEIEKYSEKSLFCKIYVKDQYLYCIPINYKAVLKIDMNSNSIKYILIKILPETYINDTTRMGDEVFGIYAYTNQIFILNMNYDTIMYRQVGSEQRQFKNMANMRNQLYLFDVFTQSVIEILIKNYYKEKEMCKLSYNAVKMLSVSSESILLDSGHKIEIVDCNGKKVFQREENSNIKKSGLYSEYYVGIESDNTVANGNMYYFSRNSYRIVQFESNKVKKEITMVLREGEIHKLKELLFSNVDDKIDENDFYNMKIWIESLNDDKKMEQKLQQKCGEKILQVVKEIYERKCIY